MSDSNAWDRILEKKLHKATCRKLPADAELDAEGAALREGWLAFSQLVEAADAESTEPKVVLLPVLRAASRSHYWSLAATLAATLLIALFGAWLIATRWNGAGGTPDVAKTPEIDGGSKKTNTDIDAPVPETALATAAWDDELDTRIAEANDTMWRVQTVARGADRDIQFANLRLEEFSRDLATDSL